MYALSFQADLPSPSGIASWVGCWSGEVRVVIVASFSGWVQNWDNVPPLMERVLDGSWDEAAYWSRANAGEAMPGVLTPLTWSFWGPAAERASRRAFVAIGALERGKGELPADERQRIIAVFGGRVAAKVSFVGVMGDRLPGTSGAAVAEQVMGTLPDDFESEPTLRRLPVIAARLPVTATSTPRRLCRLQARTKTWWAGHVERADTLTLPRPP